METLRRTFGLAEPVRRGMELKIAGEGEWRPMVLGGESRVHSDILAGRDCEISWEDVFVGEFVLFWTFWCDIWRMGMKCLDSR